MNAQTKNATIPMTGHNMSTELTDVVVDLIKSARKETQAKGAVFADTVYMVYKGLTEEVIDKDSLIDYLQSKDKNEKTGNQSTRFTKLLTELGLYVDCEYVEGKTKPALIDAKLDKDGKYIDADDESIVSTIKTSLQRNSIVGYTAYILGGKCSVTKTHRYLNITQNIVKDLSELDDESRTVAESQLVQVAGKGATITAKAAIDYAWTVSGLTKPVPQSRGPQNPNGNSSRDLSNCFNDTTKLLRDYLSNRSRVSDNVMVDIQSAYAAIEAYKAAHLAQWDKVMKEYSEKDSAAA